MANNQFEPISYDVQTLRDEFITEIQDTEEWKDISLEDTILDLYLYTLTYGMSYNLAATNNLMIDCFPHLTMADEPLYFFGNFLGVEITGAISNEGVVRFSIPSALSYQVVIPAGTKVSTSDNIVFVTQALKIIEIGDIYVDADVVQGKQLSNTYTSNGNKRQKFVIFVIEDKNNTVITVDGVEWTQVDNFENSTSTSLHYVKKYIKNGFYILFGDGIFGVKPPINNLIVISYIETKGSAGNLYQSGLIRNLIDSIYDDDNNLVKNVTVTNTEPFSNGADEDTITDIKRNITLYISTNPYITRQVDYINYLKTNSIVLDDKCYPGFEIYPADTTKWMTVYAYIVKKDLSVLSTNDKTVLNTFVKLKDTFFTKIEFVDAIYIGNNLNITLEFYTQLNASAINNIETAIDTIIANYYDIELILSDTDLPEEERTAFRNIYHHILNDLIVKSNTKIKNVNLVIQSVEDISLAIASQLSYNKTLSYTDLKSEETYLYIDDELIGTYDNAWSMTDIETAWTGKISSAINNITKVITITIIDADLVDISEPGNIVSKQFNLRSNPLNGFDLKVTNSNMVFDFYKRNFILV